MGICSDDRTICLEKEKGKGVIISSQLWIKSFLGVLCVVLIKNRKISIPKSLLTTAFLNSFSLFTQLNLSVLNLRWAACVNSQLTHPSYVTVAGAAPSQYLHRVNYEATPKPLRADGVVFRFHQEICEHKKSLVVDFCTEFDHVLAVYGHEIITLHAN